MKKVMVIEGMMCAHCAAHVKKALEAVANVADAEIDLEAKTATINMTGEISNDILISAVKEAGYTPVSVS